MSGKDAGAPEAHATLGRDVEIRSAAFQAALWAAGVHAGNDQVLAVERLRRSSSWKGTE
jgi:hypothetical protein